MPTLVSRYEIHKSCKTFEVVVNYLNDYSEAVTAIVGIQKKLAKALRDVASTKATSEVAGTPEQCAYHTCLTCMPSECTECERDRV